MTRKQRKLLLRILLSALLFFAVLLLPKKGWEGYAVLAAFLVPYAMIGASVLKKAAIHLRHGQVFDENFLMALATLGALVIGEYPEAVFVMLFYEIGELFESLAVGKSRRSIAALMDLHPDTATVVDERGETVVSAEEVTVGECLLVRPGERIPVDGVVIDGISTLHTAALTGESMPRSVAVGDTVLSGCVNLEAPLSLRATHAYHDSTAARILALVEESSMRKARSEALITRFAAYYTPLVVLAALAVAVLPALFDGAWAQWIYRALSFLVISCPCALVISVPLSFFAGLGAASRQGILIKGSSYLERLASCDVAVFDKTGTLTEGRFHVKEVCPQVGSREELLQLAAAAEHYSLHPIAFSVKSAYGDRGYPIPSQVKELVGRGIEAVVDGRAVAVGNDRLMRERGVSHPVIEAVGTVLHLCVENEYYGYLVIADRTKEGGAEALRRLKARGVKETVMLTGDGQAAAEAVRRELSLDRAIAELLPDGKVAALERLLSEQRKGRCLVYVGDGINDAPVLARADVGVAMGALGSDAAIEAADVVIMDDDLLRLDTAVGISRKTTAIVKQNIVFSLGVKAAMLFLTVFGLCSMWMAVFADVGVMVLAVLNALRCMVVRHGDSARS